MIEPITAPADQWTWVDFPTSKCASGTATGIAINPHPGATDLLIYFEGGGGCTTGDTCWGATPKAANVMGYDATTFAASQQIKYPVLSRALAANPMKAMNMAYIPYCTGDLHGGTVEKDLTVNATTMPTYFWGANDMDLFLARLVPTFAATTTHIYLLGTSAGGFGTMLNFQRVAAAFNVRVDIIDDSGPPITPKGAVDNTGMFGAWGVQCGGCTTLQSIFLTDRAAQPNSEYGFLSFASDSTISVDFGYTVAEFPAVISTFTTSLANDPHAHSFVVTNKASHVVESDGTLIAQYMPWITQLVTDDAAWTDVTYQHP